MAIISASVGFVLEGIEYILQ